MTAGAHPAPGERRPLLIVNADDYGLTEATSRAILRAHHEGIVTSTSLLTLAPGFAATAGWLRDEPALGRGAHFAAVGEDPPLLSAAEIPSLVDARGRLHLSWRTFLPAAAAGRIDPDDLRREFRAQLECIDGHGLTIDHVDTHQNLHLWPLVRRVVMALAEERGVRVIRVTRSAAGSVVGLVVRRLSRVLEGTCDAAGWRYPVASTGLDEAGHLDRTAMISALYRLAATGDPVAELATHPGEAGDPALARYEWGYQWADELEALCSAEVRAAVTELGFRLGTFADLAPVGPASPFGPASAPGSAAPPAGGAG